MKVKIHPTYFENLKITCSCGNVIIAGSTKKEVTTELCSACHPFYTGQQKLVDTAGRVDKFLAKVRMKQELNEKKVKKAAVDEMEEAANLNVEEVAVETESKEATKTPKKTAKKAPTKKKAATKKAATKKPAKKK